MNEGKRREDDKKRKKEFEEKGIWVRKGTNL